MGLQSPVLFPVLFCAILQTYSQTYSFFLMPYPSHWHQIGYSDMVFSYFYRTDNSDCVLGCTDTLTLVMVLRNG